MTAIAVIAAIQPTPTAATAAVECVAPGSKRRSVYRPATCARLATTRTSAITITQPVIQARCGPAVLRTQAKLVPQSGSSRLSVR